jgi:hypothetical protein
MFGSGETDALAELFTEDTGLALARPQPVRHEYAIGPQAARR